MTFDEMLGGMVARGYLRSEAILNRPGVLNYEITPAGVQAVRAMFRREDEEIRAMNDLVRLALSGVGG